MQSSSGGVPFPIFQLFELLDTHGLSNESPLLPFNQNFVNVDEGCVASFRSAALFFGCFLLRHHGTSRPITPSLENCCAHSCLRHPHTLSKSGCRIGVGQVGRLFSRKPKLLHCSTTTFEEHFCWGIAEGKFDE